MAKRISGRDGEHFALRLPPGYRETLREIAEQNGRSMNSEIIAALTWHISRHTADEEETQRDLLRLLQDIVDIVEFDRERRERNEG